MKGRIIMRNSKNYISPWILLTNNCNLSCEYCYIKQDEGYMNTATMAQINKTFIEMWETFQVDRVIYRIAGGEPMLNIVPMIPYLEEFLDILGDCGFVSIITNLTILPTEVIAFLRKYENVGISVSLDGTGFSKPYHDGFSSSRAVLSNMEKLFHEGIITPDRVEVSTVLTAQTIGGLPQLATQIALWGVGWGVYLNHYFNGEIHKDIILLKMTHAIEILMRLNYNLYNNFKFNNISLSENFDGCTAGNKLIAIDVDGSIYPCQTAIYGKPTATVFTDGVLDKIRNQKIYNVGCNYVLPQDCLICPILDLCGGGCKLNQKEENRKYSCTIMKDVVLKMATQEMKRREIYA